MPPARDRVADLLALELLAPAGLRAAASYVGVEYQISKRHTCRLMGLGRSAHRYRARKAERDITLTDAWQAMIIPAANDVAGTAGGGQSSDTACGTAPKRIARNGTNISTGYWQFSAGEAVCGQVTIPENWDSSTLTWAQVSYTQSGATGSQTIAFQIQIGCSTTTDDPSFATAQAFTPRTTGTTANTPYWHTLHLNSTSMTSCAPNQVMNWRRSTTSGSSGSANEQLVTFYWPYVISTAPTAN